MRPPRFVGFVRNVMVGRESLSGDVLRRAVEHAGGDAPKSQLATGNVTFSASPDRAQAIIAQLEEAIESVIGRRHVFVRSVESLASSVSLRPLAEVMDSDVYDRCVTLLSSDVLPALPLPATTPRGDAVPFAASPSEVLSVTRLIGGRPGRPGRVIESAIGVEVTRRNWNTIERIVRPET